MSSVTTDQENVVVVNSFSHRTSFGAGHSVNPDQLAASLVSYEPSET